jgi:hypothetical protein
MIGGRGLRLLKTAVHDARVVDGRIAMCVCVSVCGVFIGGHQYSDIHLPAFCIWCIK